MDTLWDESIEHLLWFYCRYTLNKSLLEAGHQYRIYPVKEALNDINKPSEYDARIRLELLHATKPGHDLVAYLGNPSGRFLSIQALYFPEDIVLDSVGSLSFEGDPIGHILDPAMADPTQYSQGKIQEITLAKWLWNGQGSFEEEFAMILINARRNKGLLGNMRY